MLRALARASPGRLAVGTSAGRFGECGAGGGALPASLSRTPPRRHMGILDKMKAMVDNSRKDTLAKKKAEVFQWQLDTLSATDRFNMAGYKAMLEASGEKLGLHDWRSMLRTKAQQAEMEDAWVDLKIANLLTPEEVADPSALHRREKLRIAGELGVDVSKVNAFLMNYEQTRTMHKWIASRRSAGIPLPSTLEEYQTAMIADKRGVDRDFQKIQAPRVRSTRGTLRRAFKGAGV